MIHGMKSTIDRAGRIVVPKSIRDAARLTPGTPLDIRVVGGHLEIEPVPVPVKLERRGKLLVAVPQTKQPPLTASEVGAVGPPRECRDDGVSGGQVYDAVIAACARKARAQTLLTWNLDHFHRFRNELTV